MTYDNWKSTDLHDSDPPFYFEEDDAAPEQLESEMELHIVIGKDGFIREQDGRQSLDAVVKDIVDGQYEDATQILRITPPRAGWPHVQKVEDITRNVASIIHDRCDGERNWIKYGSAAYSLVEQHLGIAHARAYLDQDGEAA